MKNSNILFVCIICLAIIWGCYTYLSSIEEISYTDEAAVLDAYVYEGPGFHDSYVHTAINVEYRGFVFCLNDDDLFEECKNSVGEKVELNIIETKNNGVVSYKIDPQSGGYIKPAMTLGQYKEYFK